MSSLQRRNTVSKSSGPSHMNSYALKGMPIKYKPPLFVPDIQYLPATWKPPEMLSENMVGYDYSLENAVLSQARTRAQSVAAEESIKRQHLEEVQKQQQEREEAEAKAAKEAAPRPPVFSNDILTPTPVTATVSRPNTGSSTDNMNSSGEDSESPKSTSEVEMTVEPPFKALGQMSISEFERTDDPFEIASLQAINDMEVLQSVLQPIPPPIISTPTSTQPPSIVTVQNSTTHVARSGTAPAINHSSPIPTPRTSRTKLHSNTDPSTTPPAVVDPFAPQVLPYPDPFVPSMPSNSSSTVTRGVSSSEPGVGLLIDFGFVESSARPPPTAVQVPPTATATAVDQPQGSPHPVPKPRTHLPPPYPSNELPTVPSRTSPVVPPKGILAAPPSSTTAPPILPPKPKGHVGFTIPSSSSPVSGRGGVPVLPPIPTSAAARLHPPNLPPPPYSSRLNNHRGVLPPYSSPPKTAPRGDPTTYKLPDPMTSLSVTQRSEVDSLSHMGFPPPRVARALLRCEGDNTKILDFLFLVGQLEEQKFSGDSAETALIACKEDASKALEYLKKVEGFKNIGFSEKKIHDAYEKSGQDWDKALDLLTEDR